MSVDERYAVIVDPYSSGVMLGPTFRDKGVIPIAVQTAQKPPGVYTQSWFPETFNTIFVYENSIKDLVQQLQPLHPICIIPGAESGVELADELAALVTPQLANVPSLAMARRHKMAMGEAVARADLPHIRQICSDKVEVIANWIEHEGLGNKAIMLKPPKSAGTDGVVKIEAGHDWIPSFQAILGQRNKLNGTNDNVLVQEFITGTEYVVDTFSYHGKHTVTNICRYKKVLNADHIAMYDRMEFLPYDPHTYGEILEYTYKVLDALGIQNGPAHSEIMLTTHGPLLIETGARMHGGGHPEFCRLATGTSQLDRIIAFYTHSGPIQPHFTLKRNVMVVFLTSQEEGIVQNVEVFDQALQLASHYKSVIGFKNGETVGKSADLFSAFGFIVLSHENPDQVLADYENVKRMECELLIVGTNQ